MMHCAFCEEWVNPHWQEARDADTAERSFTLFMCPVCGCGSLADPPGEEELGRYYSAAYYGRGTRKFLPVIQGLFDAGKSRLADAVMSALHGPKSPKVLDVGCGTGQLLVEFERRGARAVGIERAGGAARAVRPGLHVIEGELDEQVALRGTQDAVVIWHVLEHLRDPVAALRAAAGLLARDGLLFLAVPNAPSWQSWLFGPHWFHLDLPRHLHFLAPAGLRCVLEREGFVVLHTGTFQLSQSCFGFVQSTLNAAFPGNPNRLYRLMRERISAKGLLELSLWSFAALLLAPVALLEAVCASAAGAGSMCILVARKA